MNRNIVGIIISVISIGLFIAAGLLLLPHSSYSSSLVSNEEFERLKRERTESDVNLATTIEFNDKRIYQANDTWYYSIIKNDANAYNPNIRINDSLKIAINSNTIINSDAITKGESIDFIVYNSEKYSNYKLAITTLPIVSLHHDNTIIQSSDVDFKFELYDNTENAIQRNIHSDGKIHIRGGINAGALKSSYRINLRSDSVGEHSRKNDLSLLGMRPDDDWILYSPYSDPSKVRNILNAELWRQAHQDKNSNQTASTENRYVEVIDNGNYLGIYALGTPIDNKAANIKNTVTNSNDFLFKKQRWDNNSPIIERLYELKSEQNVNKDAAWSTLTEYIEKTNVNFDYDYAKNHIDLNSLIDYVLFTDFTNNVDTLNSSDTKNLYLSFKNTPNGYIVSYIPWDFDLSWGEALDSDRLFEVDYDHYINSDGSILGKMAKADPSIKKKVENRYAELRTTVWSNENIEKILKKYEQDVYNSGAFEREKQRWPDGQYDDTRLENLRGYIQQRTDYIDYKYGLVESEPFYQTPFLLQEDEEETTQ